MIRLFGDGYSTGGRFKEYLLTGGGGLYVEIRSWESVRIVKSASYSLP